MKAEAVTPGNGLHAAPIGSPAGIASVTHGTFRDPQKMFPSLSNSEEKHEYINEYVIIIPVFIATQS